MSVTDRERRHVFTMLEQAVGLEAAESMMELLPFQSSADLATRSDLNATTVLLQGQMAELRSELTGEMVELRTELRSEMAALKAELRGEMATLSTELRTELRSEMATLSTELRSEMVTLNAELRGEMAALRGELKGEFYRWGAVIVGANTVAVITALLT